MKDRKDDELEFLRSLPARKQMTELRSRSPKILRAFMTGTYEAGNFLYLRDALRYASNKDIQTWIEKAGLFFIVTVLCSVHAYDAAETEGLVNSIEYNTHLKDQEKEHWIKLIRDLYEVAHDPVRYFELHSQKFLKYLLNFNPGDFKDWQDYTASMQLYLNKMYDDIFEDHPHVGPNYWDQFLFQYANHKLLVYRYVMSQRQDDKVILFEALRAITAITVGFEFLKGEQLETFGQELLGCSREHPTRMEFQEGLQSEVLQSKVRLLHDLELPPSLSLYYAYVFLKAAAKKDMNYAQQIMRELFGYTKDEKSWDEKAYKEKAILQLCDGMKDLYFHQYQIIQKKYPKLFNKFKSQFDKLFDVHSWKEWEENLKILISEFKQIKKDEYTNIIQDNFRRLEEGMKVLKKTALQADYMPVSMRPWTAHPNLIAQKLTQILEEVKADLDAQRQLLCETFLSKELNWLANSLAQSDIGDPPALCLYFADLCNYAALKSPQPENKAAAFHRLNRLFSKPFDEKDFNWTADNESAFQSKMLLHLTRAVKQIYTDLCDIIKIPTVQIQLENLHGVIAMMTPQVPDLKDISNMLRGFKMLLPDLEISIKNARIPQELVQDVKIDMNALNFCLHQLEMRCRNLNKSPLDNIYRL